MKKRFTFFTILLSVIIAANVSAQDVSVTFKVDLSAEAGFDKGVDTLSLAYGSNGWDPTVDILTDANADDVYEITLQLTPGDIHQFKYVIVDGDGTSDIWGDVSGACAYDNSTNRLLAVPENDSTLETVTFTGCPTNPGLVQITFNVDMADSTVDGTGMYLTGQFKDSWSTDKYPMTNSSGDIYSLTLSLIPGRYYEYKFLNGSKWDYQEQITGDCAIGETSNRGVYAAKDIVLDSALYGDCPGMHAVTFKVKDSEGAVENATLEIFEKTFNIKQGGDTTLNLPNGSYPFKVTSVGYYDYEGMLFVDNANITDNVITLESAVKSIEFSIADDSAGLSPVVHPKLVFSHNLLKADGGQITNSNVAELIDFKTEQGAIKFSALINGAKNEITLVPDSLLLSNTKYTYGIKANALKYNDDVAIKDSVMSFTVKTYSAEMVSYADFDGNDLVSAFLAKVADDHLGASAQPNFSAAPASASNKALKFVKGTGSWNGWGKLEVDLDTSINFAKGQIFSFRIYSPKMCKIRMAVTDKDNSESDIQRETGDKEPFDVQVTKVDGWQTIYVDFTAAEFPDSISFSHLLFAIDAGVDEDNTYYLDDFMGPALFEKTITPVNSTQETNIASTIKYYPNPVNDVLTIASESIIDNIKVYTLSGQRVMTNTEIGTEIHLNLSDLRTGLYLVKVKTGSENKVIKITKDNL